MIYLYILVMALVTYLIRMIPLTVFRQKITNPWICSFLYYVPYACLTAMTVPTVFYATESLPGALAGVAAALILACCRRNLVTVAAGACLTVYIVEQFMTLFGNIF